MIGARVAAAVTDGIVLGVKYGVALILVLAVLLWAVRDYDVVRQRAQNGQIAAQYLQDHKAKLDALLK